MQMLLYKAADLGMRLSAAFQSQTGIPFSDVNLQTQNVHQPPWTQFSSLSEVSTLSMEFTYLERAAGAYACEHGLPQIRCLGRCCAASCDLPSLRLAVPSSALSRTLRPLVS